MVLFSPLQVKMIKIPYFRPINSPKQIKMTGPSVNTVLFVNFMIYYQLFHKNLSVLMLLRSKQKTHFAIICPLLTERRRGPIVLYKNKMIISNNRIQSRFYQIFHFPLRIFQSCNIQKTVLNTDPLFPYLNFDKLDN